MKFTYVQTSADPSSYLSSVFGPCSCPSVCRFYSRMWGEFIGLKSALFGFVPPLFPGGPTWGANMAWKRGMSSAPHHALSLRSELESQRGREKSNSSFSSWPGFPFSLAAQSHSNPHSRCRAGFLSEFCRSLSLSSYLGLLLPIVLLESSFSHKKGPAP